MEVRVCPGCGVKGDPVNGRTGWVHVHHDGCPFDVGEEHADSMALESKEALNEKRLTDIERSIRELDERLSKLELMEGEVERKTVFE